MRRKCPRLLVGERAKHVSVREGGEVVVVRAHRGSSVNSTARNLESAVDRSEFGLRWNQALEAGGVLVGERVQIEIEAEAVRAAAAQAA